MMRSKRKKSILFFFVYLLILQSVLFHILNIENLFAQVKAVSHSFSIPIAYLRLTDGYWQIWVMDENGEYSYQITNDKSDKVKISWAGNNKEILYNTNLGELYLINIKDRKRKKIPFNIKGMTDAQCSPDGIFICFSVNILNSIDSNDIWIARIDGSNLRKLTNWPCLQHNPVWADNGKRMVFLSGRGGQDHNIFVMDNDGKTQKQLTANSLYNFDPASSQKGRIAFSSNRTGNYEIWVMDLEGKNQKQITRHDALDCQPTWSPDGNKIAFVSNRVGKLGIWIMNDDGKDVRPLLVGDFECRSPVWYLDHMEPEEARQGDD